MKQAEGDIRWGWQRGSDISEGRWPGSWRASKRQQVGLRPVGEMWPRGLAAVVSRLWGTGARIQGQRGDRRSQKGTGVRAWVLSRFGHIWLFVTLWTIAHQAPELFQARILERVAIPSSRGSSTPRNRTLISYDSCIVRQVLLPLAPPGKPPESGDSCQMEPWPQKEMEPQILKLELKCRAPSCGISWEPIWVNKPWREAAEWWNQERWNLERSPCLGHAWDQSL